MPATQPLVFTRNGTGPLKPRDVVRALELYIGGADEQGEHSTDDGSGPERSEEESGPERVEEERDPDASKEEHGPDASKEESEVPEAARSPAAISIELGSVQEGNLDHGEDGSLAMESASASFHAFNRQVAPHSQPSESPRKRQRQRGDDLNGSQSSKKPRTSRSLSHPSRLDDPPSQPQPNPQAAIVPTEPTAAPAFSTAGSEAEPSLWASFSEGEEQRLLDEYANLNSEIIHSVLTCLAAPFTDYAIVTPHTPSDDPVVIYNESDASILFILEDEGRWSTAIFQWGVRVDGSNEPSNWATIEIYDPLGGELAAPCDTVVGDDTTALLMSKLPHGFRFHTLKAMKMPTPQACGVVDSGVHVLVTAFHLLARKEPPFTVDAALWRRIFLSLARVNTSTNTSDRVLPPFEKGPLGKSLPARLINNLDDLASFRDAAGRSPSNSTPHAAAGGLASLRAEVDQLSTALLSWRVSLDDRSMAAQDASVYLDALRPLFTDWQAAVPRATGALKAYDEALRTKQATLETMMEQAQSVNNDFLARDMQSVIRRLQNAKGNIAWARDCAHEHGIILADGQRRVEGLASEFRQALAFFEQRVQRCHELDMGARQVFTSPSRKVSGSLNFEPQAN